VTDDVSDQIREQSDNYVAAARSRRSWFQSRYQAERLPDQSTRWPEGNADCDHTYGPLLGGGGLSCRRCGRRASDEEVESLDRAARDVGRQRQLDRTRQIHTAETFVNGASVALGEREQALGAAVSAGDLEAALAAALGVEAARVVSRLGQGRLQRVRSGDFR
jgi:hypothetical protein